MELNSLIQLMGWTKATLELRPEWGSEQKDYRRLLRQRLVELCGNSAPAAPDQLMDLRRIPRVPGLSISVSHCPVVGGFLIVHNPFLTVGFDVEVAERITPEIENRMSLPGERDRAPIPGAAWVAKEATFKALIGTKQPKLVSAIETHSWIREKPAIWRFSARVVSDSSAVVAGVLWAEDRLILGIAEKIPQLWSSDAR